jgi:hypothetical protein
MNTGPPTTGPSQIERKILEHIVAAKVRLRFDKSVLRFVSDLKAALAEVIPEGQALIFTVTAPIRRRAKTAAALEALVRAGLPNGDVRSTVEENDVRLRQVIDVPAHMPKVVGFVHTLESDAGLILALTESQLRREIA